MFQAAVTQMIPASLQVPHQVCILSRFHERFDSNSNRNAQFDLRFYQNANSRFAGSVVQNTFKKYFNYKLHFQIVFQILFSITLEKQYKIRLAKVIKMQNTFNCTYAKKAFWCHCLIVNISNTVQDVRGCTSQFQSIYQLKTELAAIEKSVVAVDTNFSSLDHSLSFPWA